MIRPHIIACKPSVMNLRYLATQNVGAQVGPYVCAISAEHYFTGILHNNIKPACARTHTHKTGPKRYRTSLSPPYYIPTRPSPLEPSSHCYKPRALQLNRLVIEFNRFHCADSRDLNFLPLPHPAPNPPPHPLLTRQMNPDVDTTHPNPLTSSSTTKPA